MIPGVMALLRVFICITVMLCLAPATAFADGGVGPGEFFSSLLQIGGLAIALYVGFTVLAFAFAAVHLTFAIFLVRAAQAQNFKGKGLRYSAALLAACYVALIVLVCYLLL